MLTAQTGSFLAIKPTTNSIMVGDALPFSVEIELENGAVYGSGSFTVTYDESILRLDSFAIGNGLFGVVNTSEAGVIRFNALSISGVSNTVVLGSGQFTSLADGQSPLTLAVVDAPADLSGAELPNVTVTSGNVTVSDPIETATPSSTLTNTPTATHTPSPTETSVATETPTATNTTVPTVTSTLEPTQTPSPTGTAASTGTPIATNTPDMTQTPLPTGTVVSTQTPAVTSTIVPTMTSTASPTVTGTPTVVLDQFIFLPIITTD